MNALSKAILKTLCYADVFDYPLTADELGKYLINGGTTSVLALSKALKRRLNLSKNGYFFLEGRSGLIEIRKKRERWVKEKMKIAKRIAWWLKLIPIIKMVAVTGALAMNNTKEEDDIDFLIVASSGWLWTTRLLATILVELVSNRRRPGDKEFKNKICLNMFLDEDHLTVPENERDLFSAHEVAQMKALWTRGEMYEKFMWANRWVRKHLPNIKAQKNTLLLDKLSLVRYKGILGCFWGFMEDLARRVQFCYMRPRRTNETISDGYIRFHPQDSRGWVLQEYKKRLRKYGI